eukprot:TRINITY_DN2350_c0_g2_i4.p1 TRINITY_DN2350_c0_g2~~TRINITY_DN2350_c0_g2_i4.p1  ORF type:complete len:134 (+),score=27.77 TRINITY_DN2350_c0_g2_i4:186-587(+)
MNSEESERYRETIERETRRRENHLSKACMPTLSQHSGVTAWLDLKTQPAISSPSSQKEHETTRLLCDTRGPTESTIGSPDKINPHRERDVDWASNTPGPPSFCGVDKGARGNGECKPKLHGFAFENGVLVRSE